MNVAKPITKKEIIICFSDSDIDQLIKMKAGIAVPTLIDIPVIPRVGEWFDAKPFIKKKYWRDKIDSIQDSKGPFYVKEIWHRFNFGVQEIWIHLAMTDQDDYYNKKFK